MAEGNSDSQKGGRGIRIGEGFGFVEEEFGFADDELIEEEFGFRHAV